MMHRAIQVTERCCRGYTARIASEKIYIIETEMKVREGK